MRKMLLAVLLLTTTLSVTAISNGQSFVIAQTVKLTPKAQETYDDFLTSSQLTITSQTISKERNVYWIEFEGIRTDEFGERPIRGFAVIRANGVLEMAEWVQVF